MFYYPKVLIRHSGRFATIWLAATKGIKVTRRDFLSVDVKRTCDDIMNYILERVPAPEPGLPRPRFSLYLSSQLQYGVILVYHKQCTILLDEIQSIVTRLLKTESHKKIDMEKASWKRLDLADALALAEMTEGAPDPLFGEMHMGEVMPDPDTVIEMSRHREASAQHLESPESVPQDSDITASSEIITMKETEPLKSPPVTEFEGADLATQYMDTLSILMDQHDDFVEERQGPAQREEVTPGLAEREREHEEGPEKGSSTLQLLPTLQSSEDVLASPDVQPYSMDTSRHTPERLDPLMERQQDRERSLELEDIPYAEPARKRKRQLLFYDPKTQLSEEELQKQRGNPSAMTKPLQFVPPPSRQLLSPATLLGNPCTSLPEEALSLWRRAATVTPLSSSTLHVGRRRLEDGEESEKEEPELAEVFEGEEEEEKEKETRERVQTRQAEDGREVVTPRMSNMPDTSMEPLQLEKSDQRELSTHPSFTTLPDIPEADTDALDRLPSLGAESPVLFHSMVGAHTDRRTVSAMFHKLLVCISKRELRVEQTTPYGDIWIFPGINHV